MGYPYLLILCGLPSSGKTATARDVAALLENKHGISTMIVGSDDFRKMVTFSSQGFKPEREDLIKTLVVKTIDAALENGFLVISDDLNYYKSMRGELRRVAKRADADYDIVFVDTPVEVAIRWNKERGEPIPSSLIEEISQKFDRPAGEYKWDTPIAIVDPSRQSSDEIATSIVNVVLNRLAHPVRSKPIKIVQDEKTLKARSIERETRKSMMEVMTRYKNADLAVSLSRLRKEIVKKALAEGLQPSDAVRGFLEQADQIAEGFALPTAKGLIPVHVGLFGHVDHGKTMLARQLTEKPSTAALDKAPEAMRRGMTIDMGFSAFKLGEYIVTLVDLPGHYSLARHAIAGANIIDAAILVVAADAGLQIQSIEHFSIIRNLGIKNLVVALNKIDLASPDRIEDVKNKISLLLKGTDYANAKTVSVSGLTGNGLEDLKKELHEILKPPVRQWVGQFKMPIDHAFTITGSGTVLTGTIHRGQVKLKDIVEIQPIGKSGHVRSLRSFGEDKEEATAGERVGMALKDIKPEEVHRGYIACAPGSIKPTSRMLIELEIDKWYQRGRIPRTGANAFIGSYEASVNIVPGIVENGCFVVKQSVKAGESCVAILEFRQPVVAEVGDRVLIVNPGLSPAVFRIIGGGRIIELNTRPELFSRKVKSGTVREKSENNTCIVSGLFKSAEVASRFVGEHVVSESEVKGEITMPMGSNGDVVVKFEGQIGESDNIFFIRFKNIKF